MLLAFTWAVPPCFFILYLYLLKRRSNKNTLYDLDNDDDLHEDFERDGLIDTARGERQGLINGDIEEEDVEEEGDEDRPPKKTTKTVKRTFSLDFIAEVSLI